MNMPLKLKSFIDNKLIFLIDFVRPALYENPSAPFFLDKSIIFSSNKFRRKYAI